jgi:hypothetical protein
MKEDLSIWEAAGFLGMSPEMIARTYGHHHPDYLKDAADAIGYGKDHRVSLVVSLAGKKNRRGF